LTSNANPIYDWEFVRAKSGKSVTQTMLEAALEYAEKGWPIFPCQPNGALTKDGKADKSPLTKHGVLDATTDTQQITTWWTKTPDANIGFSPGSLNWVTLDYDPGHDMKELEANVGKIPPTQLVSLTPRGGRHETFALGDGEYIKASASKIAEHVDVRSLNSYVILPPSKTVDGSYTWQSRGKPHYRTDEMYRAMASAKSKHEDRDTWLIDADAPQNISEATRWLREKARVAIETQGGDHTTYATAAMMKGYGISQDMALDLMLENWNERCQPPWPIEELEVKVENAYAYNTSPPGNLTAAYRAARARADFDFTDAPLPTGRESVAAGFRMANRKALVHVRPPEWLIEDFIPQDAYAMLFGAYSTFKTFIALDIALTIARGFNTNTTMWQCPNPGPVLFAAGEGRSSMAKRVAAWERVHNHGAMVESFVLADPVLRIDASEEVVHSFLELALSFHKEYAMTIIDTLGRSMAGADENSQQAASAFTAMADLLRAELGCTVLASHHTGHAEGKRARGSSLFGADPDTLVRIDRKDKERLVGLTMTKQKDAPEWEGPKWVMANGVILPNDAGDSLVIVPADQPAKVTDKDVEVEVEKLALIDRAVGEALKANPSRWWTQKDLAIMIAHSTPGPGAGRLQIAYLPTLRDDHSSIAHRCFDPTRTQGQGQWQWRA
jgi:hypothetical protein